MLVSEFHEIFVGALFLRGRENPMEKGAADIKNLPECLIVEKV